MIMFEGMVWVAILLGEITWMMVVLEEAVYVMAVFEMVIFETVFSRKVLVSSWAYLSIVSEEVVEVVKRVAVTACT